MMTMILIAMMTIAVASSVRRALPENTSETHARKRLRLELR